MKVACAVAAIVSLTFLTPSRAEISSSGAVDLTFANVQFDDAEISAAVQQSDGKIIVTGAFHRVNGVAREYFARLNTDGTVDASFDASALGSWSEHLLLQSDGKILTWSDFGVDRLNADGSVDSSFHVTERLYSDYEDGLVTTVLLQADGKLLVGGNFSQVFDDAGKTYLPRQGLVRFNVDGTIDSSFDPHTYEVAYSDGISVLGADIQKNGPNAGKIVYLWGWPGAAYHIGRLNPDGSFDKTFQQPDNGGYGWYTTTVIPTAPIFVQDDDRVILFGQYAPFTGTQRNLVRLNQDGSLDTSFTPDALNEYHDRGLIQQVLQQADGKLVLIGQFHSLGSAPAHGIARLERNGARDVSFDTKGFGPAGLQTTAVIVAGDGKIFVAGVFATFGGVARRNLAWINPEGTIDPLFDQDEGATQADSVVQALAIQNDGKIIVGGVFSTVNGLPYSNLIRLNPSGTIDSSFGVKLGAVGSVRVIKLQPDGKILVAGSLRAIDGVACGRLARLNADGSLDDSLNDNVASYGAIYTIALDQFGNIFIGGDIQMVSDPSRNYLAKLNSEGNLDSNFNPPALHNIVRAIAPPTATNVLLVGGDFTATHDLHIARLDAVTGAADTSFNPGAFSRRGFNSSVQAILPTANGKNYVAGSFSAYNGTQRSQVVRLNSDGSIDTTFAPPLFPSYGIYSLLQQNDKLYAGGFDSSGYANRPHPKIQRLTSSGQLDGLFDPGSDPAPLDFSFNWSSILGLQADGRLFFGASFDSFNGFPRSNLVRLTDAELNFSAVSRRTHAGMGDFDIPLSGSPGIECRSPGPDKSYKVVLSFPASVGLSDASFDSGIGNVAQVSGNGSPTITLDLAEVEDAQALSIRLHNVTTNQSSIDLTLPMRVLVGDTNSDGAVNSADATQVRNWSGQLTNQANFRGDLNDDGVINSADSTTVRAHSGSGLSNAVKRATARR